MSRSLGAVTLVLIILPFNIALSTHDSFGGLSKGSQTVSSSKPAGTAATSSSKGISSEFVQPGISNNPLVQPKSTANIGEDESRLSSGPLRLTLDLTLETDDVVLTYEQAVQWDDSHQLQQQQSNHANGSPLRVFLGTKRNSDNSLITRNHFADDKASNVIEDFRKIEKVAGERDFAYSTENRRHLNSFYGPLVPAIEKSSGGRLLHNSKGVKNAFSGKLHDSNIKNTMSTSSKLQTSKLFAAGSSRNAVPKRRQIRRVRRNVKASKRCSSSFNTIYPSKSPGSKKDEIAQEPLLDCHHTPDNDEILSTDALFNVEKEKGISHRQQANQSLIQTTKAQQPRLSGLNSKDEAKVSQNHRLRNKARKSHIRRQMRSEINHSELTKMPSGPFASHLLSDEVQAVGRGHDKSARFRRQAKNEFVSTRVLGHPTRLCLIASCWSRCGEAARDPTECSCHADCYADGSCCVDFEWECDRSVWEPTGRYNLDELLRKRLVMQDLGSRNYFESATQSIHFEFVAGGIAYYELGYARVALCPENTTEALRNRCENISSLSSLDGIAAAADHFSLVRDQTSGVVYKNSHCALCHGVARENLTFPITHYGCPISTHNDIMLSARYLPEAELYRTIVTECRPFIDYEIDDPYTRVLNQANPLVGLYTCDQSMRTIIADFDELEQACLAYTNAVVYVRAGFEPDRRVYKNEHCVRCSNPETNEGDFRTYCVTWDRIKGYNTNANAENTAKIGVFKISHAIINDNYTTRSIEIVNKKDGDIVCSPPKLRSVTSPGQCLVNECVETFLIHGDDGRCQREGFVGNRRKNRQNPAAEDFLYSAMFSLDTLQPDTVDNGTAGKSIDINDLLSNLTLAVVNQFLALPDVEIFDMMPCPDNTRNLLYLELKDWRTVACVSIVLRSVKRFLVLHTEVDKIADNMDLFGADMTLTVAFANFNVLEGLCPDSLTLVGGDLAVAYPRPDKQSSAKRDDRLVFNDKNNAENGKVSVLLAIFGEEVYPSENLPLLLIRNLAAGRSDNNPMVRALLCPTSGWSVSDVNSGIWYLTANIGKLRRSFCELMKGTWRVASIFSLVVNVLSGLALLTAWVIAWKRPMFSPYLKACIISFLISLLIRRFMIQVGMYFELASLPCGIAKAIEYYFGMAAYLWLNALTFESAPSLNTTVSVSLLRNKWRLMAYIVYGWGSPLLLVAIFVQLPKIPSPSGNILCNCWVATDVRWTILHATAFLVSTIIGISVILVKLQQMKKNNMGAAEKGGKTTVYLVMVLVLITAIENIFRILFDTLNMLALWFAQISIGLVLSVYVMVIFGRLVPNKVRKHEVNEVDNNPNRQPKHNQPSEKEISDI